METDPLEILKHFSHYGVGWTDLRDSENQHLVRYCQRRNDKGERPWKTIWVDGDGGRFWEKIENNKDGLLVKDEPSTQSPNAKIQKIDSDCDNLDDVEEDSVIPKEQHSLTSDDAERSNIQTSKEVDKRVLKSKVSHKHSNSIVVEDVDDENNNNELHDKSIIYDVEIYLQPLTKSYLNDLVKRAKDKQTFPYSVHVKYLCRQQSDNLKSFIRNANQDESLQLKFTEFTDEDWRIVNRQISFELGEPDNLILRQFTDFDPSGNYGDKHIRCFAYYQIGDYDNFNIHEGFWEHGDDDSHAIMNALSYEYMGLDDAKVMSVDIYMNVAPCLQCVEHIRGIVLNRSNIVINVFYSSDYDERTMRKTENQTVFDEIRADYLIKMAVTPFNCRSGSHFWRFFNRAVCHRIEKGRRNRVVKGK